MDSREYLYFVQKEIHSTVMATVDNDGFPVTCAIDIMDCDGKSLYFLTARGKSLYGRLNKQGYVALTGMKGRDTLSCVAVSIRGKVRELGAEPLPKLFGKNPYMSEIYPTEQSRSALTVFQIYEGTGEWFDLSQKPIERAGFAFGKTEVEKEGYFITKACTGCRICEAVCPQRCIDFAVIPAAIWQEHCLHCGNCLSSCPQKAIIRR